MGRKLGMAAVKEKIWAIVNECASASLVPGDTSSSLHESGLIDSLAVMNIMSAIEEEFGIEIGLDDFNESNFENVDSMSLMVSKYL